MDAKDSNQRLNTTSSSTKSPNKTFNFIGFRYTKPIYRDSTGVFISQNLLSPSPPPSLTPSDSDGEGKIDSPSKKQNNSNQTEKLKKSKKILKIHVTPLKKQASSNQTECSPSPSKKQDSNNQTERSPSPSKKQNSSSQTGRSPSSPSKKQNSSNQTKLKSKKSLKTNVTPSKKQESSNQSELSPSPSKKQDSSNQTEKSKKSKKNLKTNVTPSKKQESSNQTKRSPSPSKKQESSNQTEKSKKSKKNLKTNVTPSKKQESSNQTERSPSPSKKQDSSNQIEKLKKSKRSLKTIKRVDDKQSEKKNKSNLFLMKKGKIRKRVYGVWAKNLTKPKKRTSDKSFNNLVTLRKENNKGRQKALNTSASTSASVTKEVSQHIKRNKILSGKIKRKVSDKSSIDTTKKLKNKNKKLITRRSVLARKRLRCLPGMRQKDSILDKTKKKKATTKFPSGNKTNKRNNNNKQCADESITTPSTSTATKEKEIRSPVTSETNKNLKNNTKKPKTLCQNPPIKSKKQRKENFGESANESYENSEINESSAMSEEEDVSLNIVKLKVPNIFSDKSKKFRDCSIEEPFLPSNSGTEYPMTEGSEILPSTTGKTWNSRYGRYRVKRIYNKLGENSDDMELDAAERFNFATEEGTDSTYSQQEELQENSLENLPSETYQLINQITQETSLLQSDSTLFYPVHPLTSSDLPVHFIPIKPDKIRHYNPLYYPTIGLRKSKGLFPTFKRFSSVRDVPSRLRYIFTNAIQSSGVSRQTLPAEEVLPKILPDISDILECPLIPDMHQETIVPRNIPGRKLKVKSAQLAYTRMSSQPNGTFQKQKKQAINRSGETTSNKQAKSKKIHSSSKQISAVTTDDSSPTRKRQKISNLEREQH